MTQQNKGSCMAVWLYGVSCRFEKVYSPQRERLCVNTSNEDEDGLDQGRPYDIMIMIYQNDLI